MIKYKPGRVPFICEGDSLTEQEHRDSCDVNTMLRRAANGQPIRTSSVTYGSEDMNLDLTQHLINKKRVEENLTQLARENEFDEEDLKKIPESIQKKFGFKKAKTKKQQETKNSLDQRPEAKRDDKQRENAEDKI